MYVSDALTWFHPSTVFTSRFTWPGMRFRVKYGGYRGDDVNSRSRPTYRMTLFRSDVNGAEPNPGWFAARGVPEYSQMFGMR